MDLSVEKFYEELVYSIGVAAFGYKGISQFVESKDEHSYLVMRESYLRSEHDVSPRLSFFDLSVIEKNQVCKCAIEKWLEKCEHFSNYLILSCYYRPCQA